MVLLALFLGFAQNLMKPLLAPQVVALGGDALAAGVVVSGAGMGGLLIAIPLGMALDRTGARRVIGLGALFLSAGAGVMTIATTPFVLGVGHFTFGIGSVAVLLAVQALATVEVAGVSSRINVARVSTALLIGQLAGPPLGGFLADLSGVQGAFMASFVAAAMLLPAVCTLTKTTGPSRRIGDSTTRRKDDRDRPNPTRTRPVLSRPGLVAALAASAVAMALQTTRQAFLPLLLADQGWSATGIGFILSVAGMGALVSRASFTILDNRLSARALLTVCLLPGALSAGVMASSEAVVVILIAVLVSGFSLGLAQPVTLLLLANLTSRRERGYAVGLRLAVNRLMQAGAPVVFGVVAALLNLAVAFWVTGLVCVLSAALVISRSVAPPRVID